MGHRLSKIYTRTGDDGTTGLGDGGRLDKDAPRIEAIGTVDELNSLIGLILASELPSVVRECLTDIQHDLFDLGGELAMPDQRLVPSAYSERLEHTLDTFNAELPALKEFILPAGGPATAACHLARAVCRRAERRIVTLAHAEPVSPHVVAYINRLSDLLFVLARVLSRHESGSEALWQPGRNRGA